jgi:hypothetical protein
MITVHWKHVILDEAVFSTYGTHRVARARNAARARGLADPFPVVARNAEPPTPVSIWAPGDPASGGSVEQGAAPENYPYGPLTYHFGFWSILEQVGRETRPSVTSNRFPSVNYTGPDPVTVWATAWYVWDLGSGPGGEGVYIDAFDERSGDFIADDFVDVAPDDPATHALTQDANNGFLSTEGIKQEDIKARSPTGDHPPVLYDFERWEAVGAGGPVPFTARVPNPPGSVITVRQGDRLRACAFYNGRPFSFPPIRDYPPFVILIGNLADGPYIVIRPGQPPVPVGPWDPTILGQLSAVPQRTDKGVSGMPPFW